MPLRLYVLENATPKPPEQIELNVLNQSGWTNWLAAVGTKFGGELTGELAGLSSPAPNPGAYEALKRERLQKSRSPFSRRAGSG